MTRKNALLALHKELLARAQRLCKKLARELGYLYHGKSVDAGGDSADQAFGADDDEITSRLAELDNRELAQIEGALKRWDRGVYGICEICKKPISLRRLKAIPHAPYCIKCVGEMEAMLGEVNGPRETNWGQIASSLAPLQDETKLGCFFHAGTRCKSWV